MPWPYEPQPANQGFQGNSVQPQRSGSERDSFQQLILGLSKCRRLCVSLSLGTSSLGGLKGSGTHPQKEMRSGETYRTKKEANESQGSRSLSTIVSVAAFTPRYRSAIHPHQASCHRSTISHTAHHGTALQSCGCTRIKAEPS